MKFSEGREVITNISIYNNNFNVKLNYVKYYYGKRGILKYKRNLYTDRLNFYKPIFIIVPDFKL
jgi:hypothetical protein